MLVFVCVTALIITGRISGSDPVVWVLAIAAVFEAVTELSWTLNVVESAF